MQQYDLVEALREEAAESASMPGRDVLLEYLTHFIKQLKLSETQASDIRPYFPSLLLGAIQELRTSPSAGPVRGRYLQKTGRILPDLTAPTITSSDLSIVQWLGDLLGRIFQDESVAAATVSLFRAQEYRMMRVMEEFSRRVYRKGLLKVIKSPSHGSFKGVISNTKVSCQIASSGRLNIRLSHVLSGAHHTLVITGDVNDTHGLELSQKSPLANFTVAHQILRDVIDYWPGSDEAVATVFQGQQI